MAIKKEISLTAIFVKDPNSKGYTAFFAQFPTIISEGDTIEMATQNLFSLVQEVFEYQKKEELKSSKIAGLLDSVITRSFELSVA
jgi:predicted RNase H-like HicB family nuclease